jgi:uncharacterized membrane protein required for colicin V production
MSAPLLAVSTPDTVVYALMGFFALRGAFKGFVWQLLRTGGLFGGLLLAARYDVAVGGFLAQRFSFVPATGSDVVGWGVIVVGTFLVVTLIAHLIREWVRSAELSGIDRTMGLVFGALFGLGIAAFGFTLWASTRPKSEVREALAGSKSTEYMARFIDAVNPLFPEGVRRRWIPVLESLAETK